MAAKRAATAAATRAHKAPLPSIANLPVAGDDDGIRLLSKAEVMDRVGATYSAIWSWMRAGAFPRARALGGKTVWIKSEIDAWLASLPKRPLKGDEEAA
jgi:predicted DNA-binding transcriptional regulator AlpA